MCRYRSPDAGRPPPLFGRTRASLRPRRSSAAAASEFGCQYTAVIATSESTPHHTPRTRGRPRALNEGETVAAALRLTREVGLDNLSMRALARELDVPPMTVYNYVPSKEVLQELVVNHLLREIRIPEPDEGTWEHRLRTVLRDARSAFAASPGLSAQFGDGGTAEGARLAEGVVAILRDGGFSPQAAVLCFATLFTFMTGQIDLDAMAEAIARGSPSATLEGVTRSTRFSRDELFEFGFEAVIEGLKTKLLDHD